jgi:hypothetical protein
MTSKTPDTPAPPAVKVKSRGKVNRRLELLAHKFRAGHPKERARFVYHPSHKPDLSNVLDRQIDGYRLVRVKELGDDIEESLPGLKPDDLVKVGDVVMMAIDEDTYAANQAEHADRAKEELSRVDQRYYESIEEIEAKDEHKPRPRGSSYIEFVDKEVDVPDVHKEK